MEFLEPHIKKYFPIFEEFLISIHNNIQMVLENNKENLVTTHELRYKKNISLEPCEFFTFILIGFIFYLFWIILKKCFCGSSKRRGNYIYNHPDPIDISEIISSVSFLILIIFYFLNRFYNMNTLIL